MHIESRLTRFAALRNATGMHDATLVGLRCRGFNSCEVAIHSTSPLNERAMESGLERRFSEVAFKADLRAQRRLVCRRLGQDRAARWRATKWQSRSRRVASESRSKKGARSLAGLRNFWQMLEVFLSGLERNPTRRWPTFHDGVLGVIRIVGAKS
jgi:hypothetical protein